MLETIGTIMAVVNLANVTFKFFQGDNLPNTVENFAGIGEDHPVATLVGLAGVGVAGAKVIHNLSGQVAKGSNTVNSGGAFSQREPVQTSSSQESKGGTLVNSSRAASQDELLQRLTFAKINVSIWAHCCRADGKLAEEEDQLTDMMIASLFEAGSLLAEVPNRDLACRELVDAFNDPFPVEAIAEIICDTDKIATSFYQQACLIMAIDGSIKLSEREFLNSLASGFNIAQVDKKSIEQQYLKLS